MSNDFFFLSCIGTEALYFFPATCTFKLKNKEDEIANVEVILHGYIVRVDFIIGYPNEAHMNAKIQFPIDKFPDLRE